jgi:tetratricopeptide (TPR) repeat protein
MESTALTLLKQGRSQTALRILDSNLSSKADSYGRDSPEFLQEEIDAIHILLASAIDLIEHGKHDSVPVIVTKVLSLLSAERYESRVPTQTRDFFIAMAAFLNASVQKAQKNTEIARQLYVEAATRFESAGFVTELAVTHIGIAQCLLAERRPEEAVLAATSAEDLLSSPECDQSVGNPLYEVFALAYLTLGFVEKARDALEKAVKYRRLESALPKRPQRESQHRPASSSSAQSLPVPVPPSAPRGPATRARFAKGRTAQPSPFPWSELGQLRLSVSNLVNCS